MRLLIHPPFKIRVTGVTRVTAYAKRPNSLVLTPVTRLRGCSYTRCNAAQTCNARTSSRPLRADARRTRLQRVFRWLRSQNIGRGIKRYTMREMPNNDS